MTDSEIKVGTIVDVFTGYRGGVAQRETVRVVCVHARASGTFVFTRRACTLARPMLVLVARRKLRPSSNSGSAL